MSISTSQYRASTGIYYNKLYENCSTNAQKAQGTRPDNPAIPNEIHRFGSQIIQALNSHEELNRPSNQNTPPQQGIIAPLMMLLSQVRLADCPLLAASKNSASVSGKDLSSPDPGSPLHTNSSDNSFSSMVSPVANALYATGQFISRHDPLKFPVTAASPLPSVGTESTMAADITQDIKSGSYIISGEQKKNEVISALTQYLVSDGQLTAGKSEDFELWLRSEAAGIPILIARQETESTKQKRALATEEDPNTVEHIKKHCAFEEEVLNTYGENKGKLLIFQAQRDENPFRTIYDDNDGGPSPEARGVADGLNMATDIITFGLKPLIGKLLANAKRRKYYLDLGDKICAERFRRLFIAEVSTSLDVDGLPFLSRGTARKVKPRELLNALPVQERAAFYTRDSFNNIRKEILIELKEGNAAINDNGHKIYLKSTDKPNEFLTHHPHAQYPERLERRVIVDENNLSWRYADKFDISDLKVEIREGKTHIKLHGENYELQQNSAGKYEIIVQKESGLKEFIPVYMEPLSRKWHLSVQNGRPAFNRSQIKIIDKIKAEREKDFFYSPTANNNKDYYGKGSIHVKEKVDDTSNYAWGQYIEMNGEIVPVKTITTPGHGVHYEVYNAKFPQGRGYPVDWDGSRWLFEKKTSYHVSKGLKKLIKPEMFSAKVDSGKLSAPDHRGLVYDANDNKYIKIKGKYLQLEQHKGRDFIRMDNGDKIYISFVNNKFKPEKIERYNGIVSSSYYEMSKDLRINSLSGLEIPGSTPLNEAWTLEGVRVKNTNFDAAEKIGSNVDVTLTMKYNKLSDGKYIEMPVLEWKEKIEFKEGNSKWLFQADMYNHNFNSKTFFPWRERYVEAYHFAKAEDKSLFNGNVKIYRHDMKPIEKNDIKDAKSLTEMTKNVQDFLAQNGGVMEITITDLPQILKKETKKTKERNLSFNIGFNNEVVAHFNQGISLGSDGKATVFVTTSDNIKLARGDVNAQPPEIVTKQREPHISQGEVWY